MKPRSNWFALVLSLICAAGGVLSTPAAADDRRGGARQGGVQRAPVAHPGRWWDGAHGHARHYPTVGWRVAVPPPRAHFVVSGGVRYGYSDGVWYAPYGGAFVVARPPLGIVVDDLPAFATLVTIGGIAYLYANGVYYRERVDGGYEVVPSPIVAAGGGSAGRLYVYPRHGQSAERQASDEYECHRWAADQTGFDPSAAASGQGSERGGRRDDYSRAQSACLEGRGYTVR